MNFKFKPKLHFKRFEFKYLLPVATADRIIPALLQIMDWDPFVVGSQSKSYLVNSLYFDSPALKNYYDKIAGIKNRKKFRIRFYGNRIDKKTIVFMEYKRKNGLIVKKDRIAHPWGLVSLFLLRKANINDFPKESSELLEEFLFERKKYSLKPRIIVTYMRKPLVGRGKNNLRITFDYDLRVARMPDVKLLTAYRKIMPNYLVLELKCDNIIPFKIHEIIQQYQLVRGSYSKYCYGIDKSYQLRCR